MTVSREHGGTRFPLPPPAGWPGSQAGVLGKPGFPIPPPAGGFGRAQPSYADRPLPHPPPLGEGTGLLPAGCGNRAPPPSGGRLGGGQPGFPSACGCGPEARAPRPPPAGGFGRATPSSRGLGKPGFPIRSPGGRVWAGKALLRRPSPPLPAPAGCGNRAPPRWVREPGASPQRGEAGRGATGFPLRLRMRAGGPRAQARASCLPAAGVAYPRCAGASMGLMWCDGTSIPLANSLVGVAARRRPAYPLGRCPPRSSGRGYGETWLPRTPLSFPARGGVAAGGSQAAWPRAPPPRA